MSHFADTGSLAPLARCLVQSRLHAPFLTLRSSLERSIVARAQVNPAGQTAFCASPYKTGTTYIAGLFANCNRVAHEPMHYTTLRCLGDRVFFRQRLAYLGNAFECSGFLANQLPLIRACVPSARAIYLVRPFADWLTSIVNYFSKLGEQVQYNYVCRLLFDPITRYPLDCFLSLSDDRQHTVVEALLEWWLAAYEEALADSLCLLIPLHTLDDRIDEVEDFLRLRADRKARPWKRAATMKHPLQPADFVEMAPYSLRLRTVEAATPLISRPSFTLRQRRAAHATEAA